MVKMNEDIDSLEDGLFFGGSITPPLSDNDENYDDETFCPSSDFGAKQQHKSEALAPSFLCGSCKTDRHESYLSSGFIKSLIGNGNDKWFINHKCSPVISIGQLRYSIPQIVFGSNIKNLFSQIRKLLQRILSASGRSSSQPTDFTARKSIQNALCSLFVMLKRLRSNNSGVIPDHLSTTVRSIISQLDLLARSYHGLHTQMKKNSLSVSQAGHIITNNQLFTHSLLDIYWWRVCFGYLLIDANDGDNDLFEENCTDTLEEVLLVLNLYYSVSLWYVLSDIAIDKLSSSQTEKNENHNQRHNKDFSWHHPLSFIWSFVSDLSNVSIDNNHINHIPSIQQVLLSSNWIHIEALLEKTKALMMQTPNPKLLEIIISALITLTTVWLPNNKILLSLWEYYQKNMNSNFSSKSTLTDHMFQRGTAKDNVLLCINLASNPFKPNGNGFAFFIRLLLAHLKTGDTADVKQWTSIKGRFYSKFHKRRIQELTEDGLMNMITLFLSLSLVVDFNETLKKMFMYLGFVDMTKKTKAVVVLKGFHAALLLCKLKSKDGSLPASHLQQATDKFLNLHCKKDNNSKTFSETWRHVESVLGFMEENFNATVIYIDELKSMKSIVLSTSPLCCDSENNRLLSTLNAILLSTSLKSQVSEEDSSSCQFFCSEFFQFASRWIIRLSQCQSTVELSAKNAAELTTLSSSLSSFNSTILTKHLDLFASESNVRAKFLHIYLENTLASVPILNTINGIAKESSNLQSFLISRWLYVSIKYSKSCGDLTGNIFKMTSMASLSIDHMEKVGDIENLIHKLIKSYGQQLSALTLLSETVSFRKYLHNIFLFLSKQVNNILSSADDAEEIRLLYSVMGCLFKYCTRGIYTKTDPNCLLPVLLDQMLLPTKMHQSHETLKNNLSESHLHEFLIGLSSLDLKRDQFVKRKIREIFQKYFHSVNKLATQHISSFKTDQAISIDGYINLCLGIVCRQFLVLPQPPKYLLVVLLFIHSFLVETQIQRLDDDIQHHMLTQLLGCLLACDSCQGNEEPHGIRRQVKRIFDIILCKDFSPDQLKEICSTVVRFLNFNISQFKANALKPLFEIAASNKQIVKDIVMPLLKMIETNEKERAAGEDSNLRNIYYQIVSTLN